MAVNGKDPKSKAVANNPLPEPKKTKQIIPEPKTDSRPTVSMFASCPGRKNVPVRVHLDTGYDTSILLKQWANIHVVPLVT
jgi:hypothetical protein